MEEIKGIFEGENASANIEAVKGILKEKGYDVLDEEGKKAMFSDNTKKGVDRTKESLGKMGLEILKNEQGEELKYHEQPIVHLQRMQATVADLQSKLADQAKAVKSDDPEKLKIANKALEETTALFKAEQAKNASQAEEFEAKFTQQRKADNISKGFEGLKYKDGIKPEELESAKAFAVSQILSMKTESREGYGDVFLNSEGKGMRNSQGDYITSSEMLKEKLSFMLDTHTPPVGTGTAGSNNHESNDNNSSNIYIYQGETTKMQLIKNMKVYGTTKGVDWSKQQPLYRELAATHNLK